MFGLLFHMKNNAKKSNNSRFTITANIMFVVILLTSLLTMYNLWNITKSWYSIISIFVSIFVSTLLFFTDTTKPYTDIDSLFSIIGSIFAVPFVVRLVFKYQKSGTEKTQIRNDVYDYNYSNVLNKYDRTG